MLERLDKRSRYRCAGLVTGHEIDILALARRALPRAAGAPVAFIGEARHRECRPGIAELRGLQHRRELLTAAGHDASGAVLGLFSAAGFTEDLQAEAADSRGKILLTPLEMLYGQP